MPIPQLSCSMINTNIDIDIERKAKLRESVIYSVRIYQIYFEIDFNSNQIFLAESKEELAK